MSSVDDRIVNMQFNSKDFVKGASDSQKSLGDLETALKNTAKSPGIDALGKNVEAVSGKFSAMRIAGVTAVATIANKAVNAGLHMVKSLTIDPILQGYKEYQTNLNSIQTVMANTGKAIGPVNAALQALNVYSDKTIYNFSQMAHNVGTFSAAGVGLNQSVSAIKGISNLAALSGSSAQQASNVMYQLSQAIAASRVNLQDWNSVVNAGIGGRNFQKSLIITAEAMGTVDKKSVDLGKNIKVAGETFRESISAKGKNESWLNSAVLVKTLNLLDGRLSETALKDKGFGDAEIKRKIAYQKLLLREQDISEKDIEFLHQKAEAAYQSATVVKTIPQLLQVTQEAIGSVFTNSFQNIFGTFTQSKRYLTTFSHAVQNTVGGFSNLLNGSVAAGNKKDGILTIFNKDNTSKFIAGSSGRIDAVVGLSHTFIALGKVLKTVGQAFTDAFPGGRGGVANTLLSLTANFRRFSNAIQPSAKTLESLRSIFGGLFAVLHIGFTIVRAIAGAFSGFFGEILKNSGSASGGILEFAAHIGEMLKNLDKFITSGGKLVDVFHGIGQAAGKAAGEGLEIASNLIFGIINGLVGGAAFSQLQDAVVNIGTNIIEWIKGSLGIHSPAQSMVPIGENIVEGIIVGLKFAIHSLVAILKAVVGAVGDELFGGLSTLDFASVLNAALTGGVLAILFKFIHTLDKGFGGFRQVFNQLTDTLSTMQNTLRAEALKAIAVAIGLLVVSVIALQFIDQKKVYASIGAISTLMGVMVTSLAAMSKIGTGTKGALKDTTVGSARIVALSGAMLVMSQAMLALVGAVTILAHQNPKKVAAGIGFMAAIMAILVNSLYKLSKTGPLAEGAAGAIFVMAVSIDVLVAAVTALGLLPVNVIRKGLITIALMLTGLVAAIVAISTLSGEAAVSAGVIAAIAFSLGLMTVTLVALAAVPWSTVLESLVKLGVVLLVLAEAAVIAPELAAIGAALLTIGAAFALAGVGMLAFGAGFALFAAAGTAGIAVMVAAINAFIALLPSIAVQFAAAFVSFVETIAKAAPRLRKAFDEIFLNIIGVVKDNIPVIADLIKTLIDAAIDVIQHSIPRWVEMGFTIIDKFVESAAKHIPRMADNALKLIKGFIDAIAKNLGPLADSAAKLIIAYINAIADAINNNSTALGKAGLNMGLAIVNGLTGGLLGKGVELVKNAAQSLADQLPGWMKKVLGINSPSKVTMEIGGYVADGLAVGMTEGEANVRLAAENLSKVVASTLSNNRRAMSKAPVSWGQMIAEGIVKGIKGAQTKVFAALFDMLAKVQSQGNTTVGKAARASIIAQKDADIAQAKADIATRIANRPKATKAQKALANRLTNAATSAQNRADAKAQALQDAQDIVNYQQSGDFNSAGDVYSRQATDLAKQAQLRLAKANAEVAAAKRLTGKARQLMLKQAQNDAAAAASLAKQASAANNNALAEYQKSLQARLDAYDKMLADQAWQKVFDSSDSATQAAMLQKRAAEEQQKAVNAQKLADQARIDAEAAMATDAAKAADLLDIAEQKAQEANDAAAAAKQDTEQANQLLGNNGAAGSSGTIIQPSKSVLEQAASSVDNYTASLLAAEQAALATAAPIQFVQNNYSPEELSPSEVYRQTNNLLANAEVNMGAK